MKIVWQYSFLFLMLPGCAHQSAISPSQGHLDASQVARPVIGDIPKPVKKPIYVPPPKPKTKEQTYSVVVSDVPVKEVLFALARESRMNVDISPDIQGVVTMNAVDQTLPAILDRLSRQVDMMYRFEGNVLTISQDKPVLRTYQINYVNMDRDTKGSIGVSQQIASAGSVGANHGTATGGGSNTSMTTVETLSKNHYWDTLIQNIRDILAESDKEVLVKRLGSDARLQAQYDAQAQGTGSASINTPGTAGTGGAGGQGGTTGGLGGAGAAGSPGGAASAGNQTLQSGASENSEKNLKEYKTLFAASIIANRETGVLSIRATQRQHEKIQEFIDKVQASAKRQVLIEASIVEIALNDQYQAGIDWSRLGTNGTLKGFTFQQELLGTTLSAAPRFVVGYSNTAGKLGDLAASIRLLQHFGDTKVLSSPKMMVLNSQTAILKVVDNLVYFTVQSTTSSTQTNTLITYTTTANTLPVGVWMSVTPQINENGVVTLNVRPTISRVSGSVRDPNPSLTIASNIPTVQVREMESVLQVTSGNTVMLGGLMQDEMIKSSDNVPVVSKLPLIGWLFSAKNDNHTKTELVIFLRPTVISSASLESDELKHFKQFLPEQQLSATSDEPAR